MNPITHADDQELIRFYLQGNNNAFNILLNRHHDKVYNSIFYLVKDAHLAEDIFQDAFMKVIYKLKSGSYNEEGTFLPWIITVSRNLCMDHFRRLKSVPEIKCNDDLETIINYNHKTASAEEKIIENDEHENVKQMLDGLPADQREVIILRHFAHLSFKEIANITNCSINTALGRMRYGLINLRKLHQNSKAA